MSDQGKRQIASFFALLLDASENYETIARAIINLIAYMDKTENPIPIPKEKLVASCLRYGCVPYALKIQQHIFDSNAIEEDGIGQLIDIFVKLGDFSNATGD